MQQKNQADSCATTLSGQLLDYLSMGIPQHAPSAGVIGIRYVIIFPQVGTKLIS